MSNKISMVYYWGGCPNAPTSKWHGILALLNRTIKEGWQTSLVLTGKPEVDLVNPFEQAGVEVYYHPRRKGNFDSAVIRHSYHLFKKLSCNVLHCDNTSTSPLIAGVLAGVDVRVWHKLSMSPFFEKGIKPTGLRRLHLANRVNAFAAHRVWALTRSVMKEWGDQGGNLSRTSLQSVPVPVEKIKAASAEGVREGLNLTDENFVISTVGHAAPVKGWDLLLKAFAKIAHENPEARLVVVGNIGGVEHNYFKKIEELAIQSGILEKVVFTGIRSDVACILKASDVFVLPSRSEGQPLALLEAMAAGKPCLGSAAGGIPEVLLDGQAGMLFERENVDDLINKLQQLIDDELLRRKFAEAGCLRADDFSIEEWVEEMMSGYHDLLSVRRK